MPRDRLRAFRIPDALYGRARETADARGESLSQIVRDALDRYVRRSEKSAER
jgi:predicted transcriptional regulator